MQSKNSRMELSTLNKFVQYMAYGLSILLIIVSVMLIISQWGSLNQNVLAAQRINFQSGYYINLSGGGADVNGNIGNYNDEADCDPSHGLCKARNRHTGQDYVGGSVHKYTCNGKVLNCDFSHNPGSVIKGPEIAYSQFVHVPAVPCNLIYSLRYKN